MNQVTVIAVDRAEKEAAEACIKLAATYNITINAYQIVSKDYKASKSYMGDEASGYFTEIIADFDNEKELQEICHRIGVGTVILHCRTEGGIQDYQKIIPLFPSALTPSVESLGLSTEKFKMRQAISKKFPEVCPKYIKLRTMTDFHTDLMIPFNYPVIVKPNGLNSSLFVTKCDNLSELKKSLESIFAQLGPVYIREYGTGKPSLLIEEFMEGPMYSIDVHVGNDGKPFFLPPVHVITAAEAGLGGYYGYARTLPSGLTASQITDANSCAQKAIKSIALTNSSAHVELFKTVEGWKIIELGPRIGGYRQQLYQQAYGIDLIYNDMLLHYGQTPDIEPLWHRYATAINLYATEEGTITGIHGFEEASKTSSVLNLNLYAKIGQQSLFASNAGSYLVGGVLSNDNEMSLIQDVQKVRNTITFTIDS